MRVLVTGGAGYIGSHTCVELLLADYDVIVVDSLMNSREESIRRISEISGKKLGFQKVSLLDKAGLDAVFQEEPVDAVIHFAGLKAVGESVAMPLQYYTNNIAGSLVLFEVMAKYGVKNLVFSSSATVYGDPASLPIKEDFPLNASNPYGWAKVMLEQILRDLYHADPSLNIALLRYFNPVGAHPSGRIGEDPRGIPNNLVPYIAQVAVGKLPELQIFGNDYPTPDGTGVRDYIHVLDLASGHMHALEKLATDPGLVTYNLGTGKGYSVLEMVNAFAKAAGKDIPYRIVDRRPGDIASCYADPTKAERELSWKATRDIDAMCADTWRWQTANPNGYE
ncbi:MAG: UDP-glucose 4-epimerase GalE [Deltaproteobacteria bacterium]|jgi:UDP-glucose 4-epimerase|nr:MAG: UDP-glucose 4-epimerase GalE [Deltaproteobacteria bacterium]